MATPQGSKTRGSISYLCDDKYKDTQKDAKKCLAIMDNLCGIKMVRAILSKPLLLKNTPTATEAGKPGIGGWTCSPFWLGPVVYRKKQNIPLKLIVFFFENVSVTFQWQRKDKHFRAPYYYHRCTTIPTFFRKTACLARLIHYSTHATYCQNTIHLMKDSTACKPDKSHMKYL